MAGVSQGPPVIAFVSAGKEGETVGEETTNRGDARVELAGTRTRMVTVAMLFVVIGLVGLWALFV